MTENFRKIAFYIMWIVVGSSCTTHLQPIEQDEFPKIPPGFPEISYPADNAYSVARWKLGKKLFFDPILSIDSTISCASCHQPENAFATHQATNTGVKNRPGIRNAPTLANLAYSPYFLSEGSVKTLEMQVLVPIQEHNEFAHNIVDICTKLQQDPTYSQLALQAFGRAIDPYVVTRALANYERTLISGNSAYDQFINGNKEALSSAEKRGMELFQSEKTNCSECHQGILFTNYEFKNNGLAEHYSDSGRIRFTLNPSDRGLFKTPTLRNVGITFPFMHDGSLETLQDVVAHYNSGGADHPNKSELIRPLNLTIEEQADLVAFLNALTDYSFLHNSRLRP